MATRHPRRPDARPKADRGQARFYTLVTRDTNDQEFAMHRQLFLAEQGYAYEIHDEQDVLGAESAAVR